VYFTVREASQLMGLSQSTIRRRIAAGKIQSRKAPHTQVEIADDELMPHTLDMHDMHEERLGVTIERVDRLMDLLGDDVALSAFVRDHPPKRRNLTLN
jgi:excisionase family DNA binding protein